MAFKESVFSRPRVAFLLTLAAVVTLLFFWVIKGFLVTLLLGAIMAALLHPFYTRVVTSLGGREELGSAVTVVLSLILIVIPLVLFMGVLVGQAIDTAEEASA
jgi:predicted PurR-regulated permease PerM